MRGRLPRLEGGGGGTDEGGGGGGGVELSAHIFVATGSVRLEAFAPT